VTTGAFCRNFTVRLADERLRTENAYAPHVTRSVAVFQTGLRTVASGEFSRCTAGRRLILLHFCMLACVFAKTCGCPAAPPLPPPLKLLLPPPPLKLLSRIVLLPRSSRRRFQSAALYGEQLANPPMSALPPIDLQQPQCVNSRRSRRAGLPRYKSLTVPLQELPNRHRRARLILGPGQQARARFFPPRAV
jgi:hypothetical protein